ncbi:MAG: sulfite exporter TauE/SafE family protein [Chlorobi bacterium]|nr:sulfite exporter TauE/SafE family protein [Chlorobiota bacterium]
MLTLLFFLIAILYASVGHGGASGYLALMGLWGVPPELMRPTALALNIIVSGMGMILFYKGGHLKLKWLAYLVFGSLPMAMLGSSWQVESAIYKKILGLILIIATANILLRMWMRHRNVHGMINLGKPTFWKFVIIGASIGLLSGLIGIGGGIILSPLLLLAGWTDARQTAALSAPFIFVNSTGGLSVLLLKGSGFVPEMPWLVIAVILGGFIGAYSGSFRLPESWVRTALGVVLLIAGLKLILI